MSPAMKLLPVAALAFVPAVNLAHLVVSCAHDVCVQESMAVAERHGYVIEESTPLARNQAWEFTPHPGQARNSEVTIHQKQPWRPTDC